MLIYTIACMPGQDRQFACLSQNGMTCIDHTRLTLRYYVGYFTQQLQLPDQLLTASTMVACMYSQNLHHQTMKHMQQ